MLKLFKLNAGRDRILNLTYRILTLICKFLLSILIIKRLGLEYMGIYGIFQSSIVLILYLLGMDFYTYNTREILKNSEGNLGFYISNQIVFHALIYIIILPLTLFLFFFKTLEIEYILYFYLVVVTEHISQEIYRILIALKKPVLASFILFIRSGLWVLLLSVIWFSDFFEKNLKQVFFLWCSGALTSIIIGVHYGKFKLSHRINYNWIFSGFKSAIPFFLGTIFYKIIEFSGRYFLDFYHTKSDVGVFTFFSGVANTMFVFVQSTVIVVMSPNLIESAVKGKNSFKNLFSKFKKEITYTTLVGFILAIIGIIPLLYFLDRPALVDNISVYFILLFAIAFFCLSYAPHYALYVYHKDIYLLKAAFISAFANIIFSFALIANYGVMGAAISQVLSFAVLYFAKQYFYIKKLKK